MAEIYISKLSGNYQTVIPKAVRKKLDLHPGDFLRYSCINGQIGIDRLNTETNFPMENSFSAFTEWSSQKDEKAYRDL